METEESILSLFDLYWFQTLILHRINQPSPPPQTPAISFNPGNPESHSSDPPPPQPLPLLRPHRRSHSEQFAHSPSPQIHNPILQTIFSGKIQPSDPGLDWRANPRRQRKKGESKSLTDLEFEELKGFMDLGFTFFDVAMLDPRMISIVPGLRVSSPASDVTDDVLLRNWRIPVAGEGVDMKDHLRLWAHAVASAVR